MTTPAIALVFFDGDCAFCNGWVQFITDRDTRGRFRCAPLTSPEGLAVCGPLGLDAAHPDSVVVVADGKVGLRSEAMLMIARRLPWPWPLLGIGYVVPRFLRDAVYRCITNRRHLLPTPVCRIPPRVSR